MLRHALRAPRRAGQVDVVVRDEGWSGEFTVASGAVTAVRLTQDGPIDLAAVRDLPLTRWAAAAVAVATWVGADPEMAERLSRTDPGNLAEVTRADLHRVRHRHIESHDRRQDAATPAGARSAASTHRFAAVAADHALRIVAGSCDPAGDLAHRYGCPASSVRTWLHRARLHGLDPLHSPDPDPMEAAP